MQKDVEAVLSFVLLELLEGDELGHGGGWGGRERRDGRSRTGTAGVIGSKWASCYMSRRDFPRGQAGLCHSSRPDPGYPADRQGRPRNEDASRALRTRSRTIWPAFGAFWSSHLTPALPGSPSCHFYSRSAPADTGIWPLAGDAFLTGAAAWLMSDPRQYQGASTTMSLPSSRSRPSATLRLAGFNVDRRDVHTRLGDKGAYVSGSGEPEDRISATTPTGRGSSASDGGHHSLPHRLLLLTSFHAFRRRASPTPQTRHSHA